MKELKTKLFSIMASLTLILNASNANHINISSNKNLVKGTNIMVVSVYNPALEQDTFYLMTKRCSEEEKPFDIDKEKYDVVRKYYTAYDGIVSACTLYDTYKWCELDDVITIKTNLYLEDIEYHIHYNNYETRSVTKENTNRTYDFSSDFDYIAATLPLVENDKYTIKGDYVYGEGTYEYKIETYPFTWFYDDGLYSFEEIEEMQNTLNQNSKKISLILEQNMK